MKPILYYDERSAPVRSVLMLIDLLNVDVEFIHVDFLKTMDPEFLKITPLHSVPALKHNTLVLTDSHAILIYLIEQFGGKNELWPVDPIVRIKILNKLFMNGSLLYRRWSEMLVEISNTKLTDITKYTTKLHEIYDILEKTLGETTFMVMNQMTLADIAIVATVSTSELMVPVIETKWPKLSKWLVSMKTKSLYINGSTDGITKMHDYLKKVVMPTVKVYDIKAV